MIGMMDLSLMVLQIILPAILTVAADKATGIRRVTVHRLAMPLEIGSAIPLQPGHSTFTDGTREGVAIRMIGSVFVSGVFSWVAGEFLDCWKLLGHISVRSDQRCCG